MDKNIRNSIYSGPAVDICKPYDFAEFVDLEVTKLLERAGRNPDFVEEGLDYEKVSYTQYNFGDFILEHEFNSGTGESQITFIGGDPVGSRISYFFKLHRDALNRMN